MLLTSTSDVVRLVTGSACVIDVAAEYADLAAGAVTVGRINTPITTATTTTVVAAPAASTARKVKEMLIGNNHATNPCVVTVQIFDGTNTIGVETFNLLAGERVGYRESTGFTLVGADGVDKPSGQSSDLMRALDVDATGTNVLTAQPWFPSAGGVQVEANKLYIVEGLLATLRAAGATSHTTSFLLGGTATFTSLQLWLEANTGDVETLISSSRTLTRVATAAVIKAASTSTTEALSLWVRGMVRTNAAGTVIPQFQYSAAPGGAPTIKANSYFRMIPQGSAGVTALGNWS